MPRERADLGNGVHAILCSRGTRKKKGHNRDQPRRYDTAEEDLILQDIRALAHNEKNPAPTGNPGGQT